MKSRLKRIASTMLLGLLSLMATPTISKAQDDVVLLWKLQPPQEVGFSAFSPDGKILASAAKGKVFLWKVATGEPLETLLSDQQGWIIRMAFSPDSKTLVTGDADNTICLWDVESKVLSKKLTGHSSAISALTFSADGTFLASGSLDKTVRLWNIVTGEIVKTIEGFTFPPAAISFRDEGKSLTVVGGSSPNDRRIRSKALEITQYNAVTGEKTESVTLNDFGLPVTLSPNGNVIAGFGQVATSRVNPKSKESAVRLYSVQGSQFLDSTYKVRDVKQLAFTPDGKTLAIGKRYAVAFWDGQVSPSLSTSDHESTEGARAGFRNNISFAISSDNRTYAVTDETATIRIWRFVFGN